MKLLSYDLILEIGLRVLILRRFKTSLFDGSDFQNSDMPAFETIDSIQEELQSGYYRKIYSLI